MGFFLSLAVSDDRTPHMLQGHSGADYRLDNAKTDPKLDYGGCSLHVSRYDIARPRLFVFSDTGLKHSLLTFA